jgi:hypothetical protein
MRVAFAAIVCLSIFVGLALCVLWIKDKLVFALSKKSREKNAELLLSARMEREKQLQSPDWAFYEQHLQRPVPLALKILYSQLELIQSQNFNIPDQDSISTFEPISSTGVIDANDLVDFDIVPIATTDVGDPIFLRPGKDESDSVYIAHHDGGDIESIASSVSEFAALVARSS